MTYLQTVPLLLTFVSGFVAAQETPPQPTQAAVPHRLEVVRCKASNLIGCAVTNPKNERLGEIRDIVIDNRNQRVAYAVVAFGEALGSGDKYFALPWRLLEIAQRSSDDTPRVTLGCDIEKLKAAPGFNEDSWPDMANPSWASKVDQHYRGQKEAAVPADASAPKGSAKDGASGAAKPPASGLTAHRRFSQILGARVSNVRSEHIADVEDLVIGVEAAHVDGVLLSFCGAPGAGENVALVPTEALTFEAAKRDYVLPCSPERLAAMALKDGKCASLGSDAWLTTGREACRVAREESDAKGWTVVKDANAHATRNAKYEMNKVATMRGAIVTVGTVANVDPSEDLVRLRIRLEDDREVVVHAGPVSFPPQRLLDLLPGRRVLVVGAPSVFDGRPVVLAGELEVNGKSVSLRDPYGVPTWLAGK